MEKTTNQFSTDPDVVLPLVRGGTVGHCSVIDTASYGQQTYVLGFNADRPQPYVTWSVWRTEDGKIAAAQGHYFTRLPDAVVDLLKRAVRWEALERMRNQVTALLGP